jgi:protein phosphatase
MGQSKTPYIDDLQCVVRTDVGMRRAMNQDSSAVVLAEDEQAWVTRGHVFMVADGMGAHAAGELASKLAVDNLPHLYNHDRELAAPEALEKAIRDTNAEIHRRGLANLDFRAMGTTASVLVLLPQGAMLGHVGDSRVYRLRGQQLEQLTFDHSLQWELRSLKIITEGSDSYKAVPKNVITRSLGPNANVVADLEGPFPLEIGDTFLLCSDGLSGQIEDREIGSLLAYLPPEDAATVLVDLANLRGGPDNITLVIVKIVGPGLATASTGGGTSAGGAYPGRRRRKSGRVGRVGGLLAAGRCTLAGRPARTRRAVCRRRIRGRGVGLDHAVLASRAGRKVDRPGRELGEGSLRHHDVQRRERVCTDARHDFG